MPGRKEEERQRMKGRREGRREGARAGEEGGRSLKTGRFKSLRAPPAAPGPYQARRWLFLEVPST